MTIKLTIKDKEFSYTPGVMLKATMFTLGAATSGLMAISGEVLAGVMLMAFAVTVAVMDIAEHRKLSRKN